MGFKMHFYEDETYGLAAFCDLCDEQITENDGYIFWHWDDVGDWLVCHKIRCDPVLRGFKQYGMSMPLGAEIVYLANSIGLDFDKERANAALLASIS